MNFPVPSRSYLGDFKVFVGDYIDKFTRFWNDHNQGKLIWDVVNATLGYFGNGTVSAPSITFASDLDTGWYRIGANNPGLSAGNTKVIDAKSSGVAILGTNTNDSAAAGYIGEVISSSVSFASKVAHGLTTVWSDLTSIALTPGEWDITLALHTSFNGGIALEIYGGIGTASGNSTTGLDTATNVNTLSLPANTFTASTLLSLTSTNFTLIVPSYLVQLSANTTYYAKMVSVRASGTPNSFGIISARRMR